MTCSPYHHQSATFTRRLQEAEARKLIHRLRKGACMLVVCGLMPLACFALLALVVWRDDCSREDAAPPFMQAGKDKW